jgi:hypothetical protein
MTIGSNSFLQRYLETEATEVAYGSYSVGEGTPSCLRYIYEKEAEPRHTAGERRQHPYRDFHSSNFLIRRTLMLAHPFDERFRHYGYEDVLFGKQLQQHAIPIHHMDNPLSFERFEPNSAFVSKTEEGLRTLYQFRHELQGYSRMLDMPRYLHAPPRLWHRLFKNAERRNLCSPHPSLILFKLYKAGYFFSL